MTSYTFKAGKRAGRNKYVGSWSESASKHIALPLTVDSLRLVLKWGAALETSAFTHQDIAHWCGSWRMATHDIANGGRLDIAKDIAADVDAQWDLFLSNTYDLEQLRTLHFKEVRLPFEWFQNWLAQLDIR